MQRAAARAAADPRCSACRWRWRVAGLGGYALARRALAPVERMTERARSITAERLSDRLPVRQPRRRDGAAGDGVQRDARPARGVVRADAAVHGRRLARAADAADRDPQRRRSRAARASRRGRRIAASSAACSRKSIGWRPRRSAADAVARRDAAGAALARRRSTLRRWPTTSSSHLGVLAEEKRQTIVVERTASPSALRRSAGAAAGADQPGGQRDQVHAGRRGGAHPHRRRRRARPSSTSSTRARASPREARDAHLRSLLPRPTTPTAAGTGLGLSIAKGAVEANGGHLTLASDRRQRQHVPDLDCPGNVSRTSHSRDHVRSRDVVSGSSRTGRARR